MIHGAAVAHPDLEAVARQQAGRRHARAGGADHERARAGQRMAEVDGHWSLKVESESRASRAPTM
jgi:hypothetical protein